MPVPGAVPGTPGARLIDPKVLARLADLELVARTVVEGFINGLHRSPYLGLSLDFAEHRAYMPGDDTRRIDWRLFARTDRFYVKEFEADSNADFVVVLDVSRSMGFGSGEISKLEYAKYLAASLAYFAHKQRDRVGLVTFDRDVIDFVPPSAKHLDAVLHSLDRARPGGPGELARPFAKAAEAIQRRGIMVIVSDLYEEPQRVVESLRSLGHKGSDLIVFHILDPAEVHFPFHESASYEDVETGERLPVVPEQVREEYRRLVREHIAALERILGEDRIDYSQVETATPLDQALFTYLSRRERTVRRR
jgi:uncharacterized protein (DUF58 family)